MKAPKKTKIFGMSLGVDPKLIVLILIVAAGVIYYFTSASDTPSNGAQASGTMAVNHSAPNPAMMGRPMPVRRSNAAMTDRSTLRLVPVNGARGDIDPTLRLGLLDRVKSIPPAAGSRNLFEAGGAPAVAKALPPAPLHAPIIKPGPVVAAGPIAPPPPPPFIIPLKYYGFVKPSGRALDGNRGFFLDGDNILIGAEGDVLEKRFLIVALTPNTARLEDTQAKKGQDLPVTPEAPAQ